MPAPMPLGVPPATVAFVNELDGLMGTAAPRRATPAECRARALHYSSGVCVVERPPVASEGKPPIQPQAKPKTAVSPRAPKPKAAAPALKPKASPKPNAPGVGPSRAAAVGHGVAPAAKPLVMQTSRVVTAPPKTEMLKASASKVSTRQSDAGKAAVQRPPASLRAMTGHLLISGFSGRHATERDVVRVRAALAAGRLAGVIVATSNISSSEQLRELLRYLAEGNGATLPLVALDQEGGPEAALGEEKGFSFYPSAKTVGQSRSLGEARALYREMAAEMSSLGVTLNLGPALGACDDRRADFSAPCFAAAEPRARAFAAAFTRGHHDRGVLTALRAEAFGARRAASLRRERASAAMLRNVVKFDAADAVILRLRAGERVLTATVSSPSSASRLGESAVRRDMAFGGAIIADLDLGGAPLHHGDAVASALIAGADLVLVRATPDVPQDLDETVYEAVEAAVVSGRLPRARVEDAWRHVLSLKARLDTFRRRMQTATVSR
ncbi:hypothetical protein KKP04_10905 [Rhodomicrobium sp. Az07]|uniref:glycoside hydrolase family 3 N-terminal domain-containing protein n=1 Tax=Rhodomicrobium sp. Az07 TaxID=2839034 RepID=UPI001BEB7867|nr:glycoside hydrolase family 3 N-terminal domain-containing protein [Rhodomicrobium sp. Az07]MBT3071371.1 hypothetical protein [Rhodomicrobium sp. Az07]